MHKAQKIRRWLGGNAGLAHPFPGKPKHMHWRTYWRLRQEAEEAEYESLIAVTERFGLLADMLERRTVKR